VARIAAGAGLPFDALDFAANSRRENRTALAALLARHSPDIVDSQSSSDRNALVGLAMRRQLGVPFVATRRQMPRTAHPVLFITSRFTDHTIAVSAPVRDALIRRGVPASRISVVPNGLIVSRVDRAPSAGELDGWRARIRWDPSVPTLGIIARLKDQHVVLQALEQVSRPVRLVIAGVPPEQLAGQAARVPSRHQVVLLPFAAGVRPLHELLDWLLLPSRMEGLSQALLEGMALGLPVMASRAGGNTDLVRDGVDGFLLPPLDAGAWARAIEEHAGNRAVARELGAAARERARRDFSLEHTITGTMTVLERVLAGG
jgi:glycosyltransferase involved in cell wall biosynthesis